jgi:Zn finger protein HypA/HybF involved in hydrogenase expression
MRLATARDELVPLYSDLVKENPAYLTVVLISRVLVRLGTVTDINPHVVEYLFASDLAFLQDLYRRVNQEGHTRAAVSCPACQHEFSVDVAGGRLGES